MGIYTVGHGEHSVLSFMRVLKAHKIDILVDVRSQPARGCYPGFKVEEIGHILGAEGILYVGMGAALGGHPKSHMFYTRGSDVPDYNMISKSQFYNAGIEAILKLATDQRVVLMGSDGDYSQCHRHFLIAQTLMDRGATVIHIKPDGGVAMGQLVARQSALFLGEL